MDEKRFQDVEQRFNLLSDRHKKGEVDSETLKKELKKMMILDEEGKYWMLGGKTGKWYIYNGKEWNEDNPYEKVVSKKEEVEAFKTVIFTKEQTGSAINRDSGNSQENTGAAAGGEAPIREDSSTIKLDALSTEKDSVSDDVDFILGQEDRSGSDFEVVSTQPYNTGADHGSVSSREQQSGGSVELEAIPSGADGGDYKSDSDFEVVSTQDDLNASDYNELDLTREDGAAGHEVILPREESGASELKVVSSREDSESAAADKIEAISPAGEEAGVIDLDSFSKTETDSSTIRLDAALDEEPVAAKAVKKVEKTDELVISSIDLVSLIFFLGGIGCVIGVLFGATFGIFTGVFGNLIDIFPELLRGAQGGIAGGIIFAAIGGIGGFIAFGILAIFVSSLYNLIAYIFGGIRVKIK